MKKSTMRGPSTVVPARNLVRNLERRTPRKFGFARLACIAIVVCIAMSAAHAQTWTLLASFNQSNGDLPQESLVQGVDGNFYGTTMMGGANFGGGNVFKVTPTGQLTSLYNFCSQPNCTDGGQPLSALVLGANGNLYGTTTVGGANVGTCLGPGCGTVFEITPAGKLTTVYSFCSLSNCTDGAVPEAGLVLASNGNFYGTTYVGGANGRGTVFELTPGGKLTTLYSFCTQTNCADGSYPVTDIVQGGDGNLYGTTYDGGAIVCPFFNNTFGCGTIFRITLAGQLTTLYNFGTDAGLLQAPVVQGRNSNFYGTGLNGGTSPICTTYGCGNIFEMTPAGTLTTLYSFCTQEFCPDGAYPMAGLVSATDGKLYGSTTTGGQGSLGTIFAISPTGVFNTVWNFAGTATGYQPQGALLQATNGKFYGLTNGGGAENQGTIFSLSIGLAPFVETLPTSGRVGAKVMVLGYNLAGATAVTFNGTAATFTVVSNTRLVATVPTGATSGAVVVSTAGHSLKSNTVFRVAP